MLDDIIKNHRGLIFPLVALVALIYWMGGGAFIFVKIILWFCKAFLIGLFFYGFSRLLGLPSMYWHKIQYTYYNEVAVDYEEIIRFEKRWVALAFGLWGFVFGFLLMMSRYEAMPKGFAEPVGAISMCGIVALILGIILCRLIFRLDEDEIPARYNESKRPDTTEITNY